MSRLTPAATQPTVTVQNGDDVLEFRPLTRGEIRHPDIVAAWSTDDPEIERRGEARLLSYALDLDFDEVYRDLPDLPAAWVEALVSAAAEASGAVEEWQRRSTSRDGVETV